MKTIRKSTRTFLFKEDELLVIKYTTNDYKHDYYDVPGGGLEPGETSEEAAIREYKEETGMDITNPEYAGNLIIELPDRVYDLDIYLAYLYSKEPRTQEENTAEWMKVDELLKQPKKFVEIYLLDEFHREELFSKNDSKWYFISNREQTKFEEILCPNAEEFKRLVHKLGETNSKK